MRYSMIPMEIIQDTRLKHRALRVLLAMASFCDRSGRCFPKRKTLADITGYTEAAISKATSQLVDLGWLEKLGKGGYGKPCEYIIKGALWGTVPCEQPLPQGLQNGALWGTRKEHTTEHTSKNTPIVPKGTTCVPDQNAKPETPPENKPDPNEKHQESFDAFWTAYPVSRRKDRKRCFAKWCRLTVSDREQIMDDIAYRSEHCLNWSKKENWHFVPHMATYMNQQRWLDEDQAKITKPKSAEKFDNGAYLSKRVAEIKANERKAAERDITPGSERPMCASDKAPLEGELVGSGDRSNVVAMRPVAPITDDLDDLFGYRPPSREEIIDQRRRAYVIQQEADDLAGRLAQRERIRATRATHP